MKCRQCGNEITDKKQKYFCCGDCMQRYDENTSAEHAKLRRRLKNLKLQKELLLAELEMELLPPLQFYALKSEFVSPEEKIEIEMIVDKLADNARIQP
jgi:uncharacterized membrane protein YvbJ